MLKIDELLQIAVDRKASDLHLTVGIPPVLRINGTLERMDYGAFAKCRYLFLDGRIDGCFP